MVTLPGEVQTDYFLFEATNKGNPALSVHLTEEAVDGEVEAEQFLPDPWEVLQLGSSESGCQASGVQGEVSVLQCLTLQGEDTPSQGLPSTAQISDLPESSSCHPLPEFPCSLQVPDTDPDCTFHSRQISECLFL